ncbi:MAG: selenium metabolism-associated LysR family transcriptional regulator [Firmicutes bacterium]|nr:selenium metabolism-associated LysR family transcriptional regulator [Bacillota bacterium]
MNFKQLEAFVRIAEMQSFTRAARQMYMSQPAISFQIKALEDHLQVLLFKRDEKKVLLTEAGRLLLPEAKQMLGHYKKIKAGLASLKGLEIGRLSVGAGTIPGEYLLPALIGRFRKLHPGVKVKMRIAGSGEVISWLKEREIDLGVVGSAVEDDNLEVVPWLEDELLLAVPAGHGWAGKLIDIADLPAEKYILREEGSGTRRSIAGILAKAGFVLEQCAAEMELGSTRAVLSAVQAGLGVGFISRWAADEALAAGKISAAKISGVSMHRQLFIVRYIPGLSNYAADAFFAFLKETNPDLR